MSPNQTIIAAGSGWGHSARAMVRVSGPAVPDICRLLRPPIPVHRGVTVSGLPLASDDESLRLPCLAMCFPGPSAYTGEDVLELVVPGNPVVVERVLERLCRLAGVREARPGEFSARGFLNGRIGLAEAEGVAAIIAAGTEDQLLGARRVLDGSAGREYGAWTEELATLLALVEAGIDFTDQEDVVPIAPVDLARRLEAMRGGITARLGGEEGLASERLRPRVVLAGRPNAGKSTLFNALLRRRGPGVVARAVESPVAGTTRDVLVEELDLAAEVPGGLAVDLVDLAGLDAVGRGGGGEGGGWRGTDAQAQRLAATEVERAEVVIHCDPTGRFEALPVGDGSQARTVVRVRTKADVPGLASDEKDGADGATIPVCALDGWNLPVLRRAIADAAWGSGRAGGGGGEYLLPRHRRTLGVVRERLAAAGECVEANARMLSRPEVVAGELRLALDQLGELTGAVSPDDIVGRIFATFCVGK